MLEKNLTVQEDLPVNWLGKMLVVCLLAAVPGWAQVAVNCNASAVPAIIRLEGQTERLGDILLNCSGGPPNGSLRGDFTLFSYAGNITNRQSQLGNLDAILTANNGSGEVILNSVATLAAQNQIRFSNFQVQLSGSGSISLRITNVRIAPVVAQDQPVQIGLANNGQSEIRTNTSSLTAGFVQRALFASHASTFICTTSPMPDTMTFTGFVARGVRVSTTRITEGFGEAFLRRGAQMDTGMRIALRYSGFPAGARLFTPSVIVGSSGSTPTSVGDFGTPASGGQYTPTSNGQLLLSRVANTDPAGAQGQPTFQPPPFAGPIGFDSLTEIPLTNGAGMAVFEVVDAVASLRESAQIPTFLVLDQRPANGSVAAQVSLTLAPFTALPIIPTGNPVPRFQVSSPPADCGVAGDCDARYFPKMRVESPQLLFDPVIGSAGQNQFIRILNDGGGVLNWAATVEYRTGSGWLRLDPYAGQNNGTIRLDTVTNQGFPPGVYEANIVIDGGPIAGVVNLPVRMQAREFLLIDPEIVRITNGATFGPPPLAPGTIATIFGNRLGGENVTVLVGSVSARVLFAGPQQINFEIPRVLTPTGRTSVQVIVDQKVSAISTVELAPSSPGIFAGAVTNQDFSVNSPSNPARAGSVIQIFATGLPDSGVTARLHDQLVDTPLYAGPAPGFVGVQQVNLRVPDYYPAFSSEVTVCGAGVCSPPRPVSFTGQ